MGQLTPEDFARMQREAKMRVAEMQKRSRYYTENSRREQRRQNEEENGVERVTASDAGAAPAAEPVAGLPAEKKRDPTQKEETAELLLLLFLSFLVGEVDHDLFLFLMFIMFE